MFLQTSATKVHTMNLGKVTDALFPARSQMRHKGGTS
jgi:hypothetical protein